MAQDPQPTPKPNVVKEARQRQLIDATISTIGRVGYSGTTLTHVAGAAGLSPGISYVHYQPHPAQFERDILDRLFVFENPRS